MTPQWITELQTMRQGLIEMYQSLSRFPDAPTLHEIKRPLVLSLNKVEDTLRLPRTFTSRAEQRQLRRLGGK